MLNKFHCKHTLSCCIQMLAVFHKCSTVVQCVTVALMEYCFWSVKFFILYDILYLVGHMCGKNSRAGVRIRRRDTWRPVYDYWRPANSGQRTGIDDLGC